VLGRKAMTLGGTQALIKESLERSIITDKEAAALLAAAVARNEVIQVDAFSSLMPGANTGDSNEA